VRLAARLRPDVITMDVRMPRMNGLQATRKIMSTTPRPIVVVADGIHDTDLNTAAIAAGALAVVEKPTESSPADYDAVREQLVTTIRLMADVPVVALWPDGRLPDRAHDSEPVIELIAMAASTGGPGVLRQILGALPGDLSIPIVIVQHITRGFVQGFANWLNDATALEVSVAKKNERIAAGRVLIAPNDTHVVIDLDGVVRFDHSAPVKGLRPSATLLFNSVAKAYGAAAVGVVLTGMGEDGAEGLKALQLTGGRVIAQDEESCVIFGMPKAAIEQGVVDQVLLPDEIATVLNRLDKRGRQNNERIDFTQIGWQNDAENRETTHE
jgi:two-component system chemotaxis response regulator CheB